MNRLHCQVKTRKSVCCSIVIFVLVIQKKTNVWYQSLLEKRLDQNFLDVVNCFKFSTNNISFKKCAYQLAHENS